MRREASSVGEILQREAERFPPSPQLAAYLCDARIDLRFPRPLHGSPTLPGSLTDAKGLVGISID
jgi:hypothetical protein